jgi:hypothetical protein
MFLSIILKKVNMSDQLQMFNQKNYQKLTLSLSEVLAKILVWLEKDVGWKDKEVVLSQKQLDSFANADLVFLSGKMLKEHSPQTMVKTFGQYSKSLPTLGAIDLNGNCLTQNGFYPKIERESTLSDILEKDVKDKYFLSQKMTKFLIARSGTTQGNHKVTKIDIQEQ